MEFSYSESGEVSDIKYIAAGEERLTLVLATKL